MSTTPEQQLISAELRAELLRILDTIPPRQRAVLVARYGLDGSEPLTASQIATIFEMKPATVRALEKKALGQLRESPHFKTAARTRKKKPRTPPSK